MKVSQLLDDISKWTRLAMSRDANGNKCNPEDGVCWDLYSAILKCCPHRLYEVQERIGGSSVMVWNDCHSYEEVMKLVKELDL